MIVYGSCARHHLHLGAGRFACIERLRQGRCMRCRLNEQPASDQKQSKGAQDSHKKGVKL